MSTYHGLQLVRSDQGDGGWSLHLPEEFEDEDGWSPLLITDTAMWSDEQNDWDRPTQADYQRAREVWDELAAEGKLPKRDA